MWRDGIQTPKRNLCNLCNLRIISSAVEPFVRVHSRPFAVGLSFFAFCVFFCGLNGGQHAERL